MAENIILLFAFFTLTLAGLTSPRVVQDTGVTPSCQGLQSKHEFSNFSVSQRFISDDNLSICVYNDTTCCTEDMELRLHTLSQSNIRNIQTAKTDLIRKIFSKGVIKFKDFFEAHIDSSDRVLDEQFTKRYKNVYANNSYVTKSFYDKLRKHYKTGEYKTSEIVDEFFKEVLKKMYLLIKGGKAPNIDMNCVTSTYDKIKPFGVVPRQIIPRLERSITAARTMIYSLHFGKLVVEKLSDDRWFSDKCLKSVTKMSQCSICAGYSNLKPCAGHCIDVFTQCFSSLTEMKHVWDEYLSYLDDLGYKLTAEYDFYAVTGELPYDISHGISNCQEELPNIIPKIDKYCKTGKKKKQTRSVITSDDDDDFFLENNGRVERSDDTSRKRPKSTIYSQFKLINTYRRHFNKLKKFWTKLPTAMCDETVVATNATAYCWDGSNIVNNTVYVQQGNINLTSPNGQNDKTITSLISQLKSIIKSMKAAVEGTTVNHPNIPDGDPIYSGSGEGSGSGSGDGNDDEDATSMNEIPVIINEPLDENSVDIPEVLIKVKSPDLKASETGRGGASYLHTSVLLLITSLLVQLM